uniref:Uncharacterized protein n=1 Tax=Romanomermis culicivorax TaxID=13658 RepID=A0A915KAX9_ROMCU
MAHLITNYRVAHQEALALKDVLNNFKKLGMVKIALSILQDCYTKCVNFGKDQVLHLAESYCHLEIDKNLLITEWADFK